MNDSTAYPIRRGIVKYTFNRFMTTIPQRNPIVDSVSPSASAAAATETAAPLAAKQAEQMKFQRQRVQHLNESCMVS